LTAREFMHLIDAYASAAERVGDWCSVVPPASGRTKRLAIRAMHDARAAVVEAVRELLPDAAPAVNPGDTGPTVG